MTPTHIITEVYGSDRFYRLAEFSAAARNGDIDRAAKDAEKYLAAMRKLHPMMRFRSYSAHIAPNGRMTRVS